MRKVNDIPPRTKYDDEVENGIKVDLMHVQQMNSTQFKFNKCWLQIRVRQKMKRNKKKKKEIHTIRTRYSGCSCADVGFKTGIQNAYKISMSLDLCYVSNVLDTTK